MFVLKPKNYFYFGKLLFYSFVVIEAMIFIFKCFDLKINFTASMPLGIYKRYDNNKLLKAEIVSVCLPTNIAAIGKLRGYIGNGLCPNNSTLLLKKVIAVPGDTLVLSQQAITINGISYYAPQQRFDHNHKPIKRWVKNGVYKHIKGVWLYGSHDPIHSWDSRYFGSIPTQNIRGIYKPLWVLL